MFTFEKIIHSFFLLVFSLLVVSCSDNSVSTIAVSGKVIDQNGYGFGSALVSINGGNAMHVNSDGTFNAGTVSIYPFSIMVFNPIDSIVTQYVDMYNYTPYLRTQVNYPSNDPHKTAPLIIYHPKAPQGKAVLTAFFGSTFIISNNNGPANDTTLFFEVNWPNEDPLAQGSFAIMFADTSGNSWQVDSIISFGYKHFYLSPGTLTTVTFNAADLTENISQGSVPVSVPTNSSNLTFSATIGFDGSYAAGGLPLAVHQSYNGGFILIPNVLDIPFNITLQADDHPIMAGSSSNSHYCLKSIHTGSPASLIFASDVSLLSPADGATGVNGHTAFSFDGGSDYEFGMARIYNISSQPKLELNIYTSAKTFTLPDLSPFGISLSNNTEYNWNVTKINGYQDLSNYCISISFVSRERTLTETSTGRRSFRYGQ